MFALRQSGARRPAVSSRPVSASRRLRELQGPFATLTAVAALLVFERPVIAGPTGGQVVGGSATISQSGPTTNVNQSSQSAIINWQSFSIAPKETVNFNQPNSSSVALNRVIGNEKSIIAGALNANGRVFIVNSAGVLFTKGAQVNVGGLVASTLNISNADFMAGNYRLTGTSGASVVNRGHINAGPGGYVALLGRTVVNDGVISARLGTVAMASGEQMTLNFGGDSLVDVTIDKGTMNALVANHRLIKADGGQVIMTAKAADQVLSAQVNNTGIVQARTIASLTGGQARTGKIKILASGGTANIKGRLDASAPKGGNGGTIETSGDKVNIADSAVITTKAANGQTGTWLIDPDGFTIGQFPGNDISGAQLGQRLASNNITIASTQGLGTGGNINVNQAVTWGTGTTLTLNATNAINVNAVITAPNGKIALNAGTDVNINAPSSLQAVSVTATAHDLAINPASTTGDINFNAPQTWTSSGPWTFSGININVNDTVSWSAGAMTLNAGFNGTTPGVNAGPGFINLNAVMTVSGTGSFVATYALDPSGQALMDKTMTTGSTMPSATYGTQLSGINPLFDPAVGTFVGRIDFVNNTAANPLTINTNSYTLITSIGQPKLADGVTQNPHDLSAIDANGDTGFYALAANLDAARVTYTAAPIASSSPPGFTGTLEGLGHTINNLTITPLSKNGSHVGLIGTLKGGTVRDIGVQNVVIVNAGTRGIIVGSLAAESDDAFIINSFASGSGSVLNPVIDATGTLQTTSPNGVAVAANQTVGGLVATSVGSLIVNSHADVSVYGASNVGGLVGTNANDTTHIGVIQNSYSTGAVYAGASGSVTQGAAAGGLAALNNGVISNSYETGTVTARNVVDVGGLVGQNQALSPGIGTLTNVSSSGSLTYFWNLINSPVNGGGVGGLVGRNDGQIANGYTTTSLNVTTTQSVAAGTLIGTNNGINTGSSAVGNTITCAAHCTNAFIGIGGNGITINSNPAGATSQQSIAQGAAQGAVQGAAGARSQAQGLTQQAGLQQAAAQGNVINAANVSANVSTAMTSSTGANPGASAAGTGSTNSTGGSIVDSNIQYEGGQATPDTNRPHRRTASNRQNNRNTNFGATIRTIEINGRPFRLRGGGNNNNPTPQP